MRFVVSGMHIFRLRLNYLASQTANALVSEAMTSQSPPLSTVRPRHNIFRYLLTSIAVIAALVGLKLLIAWAAEMYLHPIPILGGWLKSLEIVELVNIVIFALLGLGLGGATLYLPSKTPLGLKAIMLVVAIPLVFFSSYWLRHALWLNQLAAEANQPVEQVSALADQALLRESGSRGFWGYFKVTTKMPILPATVAELERMTDDQRWFRSELTRFSGIEPGVFSMIFDGAGWGIRLFHMALATLTGIVYFFKGLVWADTARLKRLTQAKR